MGEEAEWTVVESRRTKKPSASTTKSQSDSTPQAATSAPKEVSRWNGFRTMDPRTLNSLPRQVQIDYYDRQSLWEKRHKEEMECKHAEWRIREENRQRRAWIAECRRNGTCLNCGVPDHGVAGCDKPKFEPFW